MKQKKCSLLNRMTRKIICNFLFIFIYISIYSAGTCGADFLTWNIGGAPSSMAGAYSSIANGVYSLHYNPAGLSRTKRQLFGFSHFRLFHDTNSGNLVYILPDFFNGSFGIGFLYNNTQFEWFDEFGGQTPLSIYDIALNISYSKKILKNSSLGINLKGFKRQFDDVSSEGFGADIGFLTSLMRDKLNFGFVIQNIGYQTDFYESNDPMPLMLKAGMSYTLPLSKSIYVLFSGDVKNMVYENDQNIYFPLGMELGLFDILFVRGGYDLNNKNSPFTAGIGINILFFTIDYAFNYHDHLGTAHNITLIIDSLSPFEKKMQEKREIEPPKKDVGEIALHVGTDKEDDPIDEPIYDILTRITLYYGFNEYKLENNHIQDLRNLISILKDYPDASIVINGHADSTGEMLYNISLSKKRAERVRNALVNMGIDRNMIKTVAFGFKDPVSDNETEEERALNRRCEIIIVF